MMAAVVALLITAAVIDIKARRRRRVLRVDSGAIRDAKLAARVRAAELGPDVAGIYVAGMVIGDAAGGGYLS